MTVEQESTEEVSARYLASQTLSNEKLQKAITDEGVTWTDSDDSVATVDGDGQIMGITPGTATIAVSCTDGKVTGSTEVREVKMTSETATNASLALESSDDAVVTVDETGTLRAAIDGDSVIATTAVQDVFIYRQCERHHRQ